MAQSSRQSCRDIIIHQSSSPSPYHVFYLPGNPGLVEYYAGFLSLLYDMINSPINSQSQSSSSSSPSSSSIQFNIAGYSFAGFETKEDNDNDHAAHEENNSKLYDITKQVDFSLKRLQEYIRNSQQNSNTGHQRAKVILIGHSFGTFVITEMMKRIYQNQNQRNQYAHDFDIIGSILLFPPIPDIEKSPTGAKLAFLAKWKHLPSVASYAAKALCSLPLNIADTLIRYVTAFPSDATNTTRTFFGSKTGVAQALYLAKYEMEEIKLHQWEAAFQTVASYQEQHGQNEEKTCFRLFFGKEDHWVDNELRDAFLYKYCDDAGPKAFGKHNLDIQAQIDPSADGDETSIMIPHDFSIRHSEHVVPHVARYIEEIVALSRT